MPAGEVTGEVKPDVPHLDGLAALIAAVRRKLDTPVGSADGNLAQEKMKDVIDIEEC